MAAFCVIIPSAGRAERFGGVEKKTFAKLNGRPVFIRTLEHFINRPDVCQTILAVAPEDVEAMKSQYGPNLAFMGVKLVEGGERRRDTVAAALQFVDEAVDYIAVHDAARPCVTAQLIDEVFAEAVKSGAAIPAVPITGTIKRVSGANVVEETAPRDGLFEAQTPQVFRKELLAEAYARLPADAEVTDDAEVVERAGHAVAAVPGDATNLKITAKSDMTLANAIVKSRPAKAVPRMGAFEEAQW